MDSKTPQAEPRPQQQVLVSGSPDGNSLHRVAVHDALLFPSKEASETANKILEFLRDLSVGDALFILSVAERRIYNYRDNIIYRPQLSP